MPKEPKRQIRNSKTSKDQNAAEDHRLVADRLNERIENLSECTRRNVRPSDFLIVSLHALLVLFADWYYRWRRIWASAVIGLIFSRTARYLTYDLRHFLVGHLVDIAKNSGPEAVDHVRENREPEHVEDELCVL